MKKIMMIFMVLLLAVSMAACTDKQDSSVENEKVTQESTADQKEPQEASGDGKEVEEKNLEGYRALIGLSREEVIEVMGEEPVVIDEDGLEFSKANIRVWFIEDGEHVDQVFIDDRDVDFNGAKLGGNIEDFKNAFGEPSLEDTGSAYSNFDYEGLVLHLQYDPGTGKVFAAYIMKEWK